MLLCTCCMPALAANWYYLGRSNTGETLFIDNASVWKDANEAVVWVKYNEPDRIFHICQYKLRRGDKSIALISGYTYNKDGNVIYSYVSPRLRFERIEPHSRGAVIYRGIWGY